MPLKLVPPRSGQSHNWRVRGTHLGVAVDKSIRAPDRAKARMVMRLIQDEIERGMFARRGAPTFADAAGAYMDGGGDPRFLPPLIAHFKDTPLSAVDQRAIDQSAIALYPNASPATRNRQVHTPVSAILRHAGVAMVLRRPKGASGTPRTAWLSKDQMFALMAASDDQGASFGALMRLLFYTGSRVSEALTLRWGDVDLDKGLVRLRQTKEETERAAIIPPFVVEALRPLRRAPDEKAFRLTKSGFLYDKLTRAAEAAGVKIPERVAFHICRHTWATMMRREGGLDTAGLVETGAWKSRVAASRYEHLDASEEAAKALMLPVPAQTIRVNDV
jgi:integrase